jgi:hypothetical protein
VSAIRTILQGLGKQPFLPLFVVVGAAMIG